MAQGGSGVDSFNTYDWSRAVWLLFLAGSLRGQRRGEFVD